MSIVGAIVLAAATIVADPATKVECAEANGLMVCEMPNPTPDMKRIPSAPIIPTIQEHLKFS